jgi:hypothetical protein
MPTVFLSYSSRDKHFASRLYAELTASDVTVWLDEHEIQVGDDIRIRIEEGLGKADYFAVVLSGSSVGSSWVQKELSAALTIEIKRNNPFILPILLEDIEVPALIAGKKHADFRTDHQSGLDALLKVLGRLQIVEYPGTGPFKLTTARRGDFGEPPLKAGGFFVIGHEWSVLLVVEMRGEDQPARIAMQLFGDLFHTALEHMFKSEFDADEIVRTYLTMADIAVRTVRLDFPNARIGARTVIALPSNGQVFFVSVGNCGGLAHWTTESNEAAFRRVDSTGLFAYELTPNSGTEHVFSAPLGSLKVENSDVQVLAAGFSRKGDYIALTSFELPVTADLTRSGFFDKLQGLPDTRSRVRFLSQYCQPQGRDSYCMLLELTADLSTEGVQG